MLLPPGLPVSEDLMTKLERELYLLALNNPQRLALLLSVANHLRYFKFVSDEEFDDKLTSYRIETESRDGGPKKRRG